MKKGTGVAGAFFKRLCELHALLFLCARRLCLLGRSPSADLKSVTIGINVRLNITLAHWDLPFQD
jgi:hypothetical protein